MQALTWNFVIERGADFRRVITWTDEDDAPVSLAGYDAHMQIRKHSWDGELVYDLVIGDGIDLELHGTGTIDISISAAHTALAPLEKLVHDLFLTIPETEDSPSETVRFTVGTATVKPRVTQEV